MKILTLVFLSLLSCALNDPPAIATEDITQPCHDPLKVERTDSKIVFTPCNGEPTEISFSELKGKVGPIGKKGNQGDAGPRGPAGSGSVDSIVPYCMHNEQTHLAQTVNLKQSEIVGTRQGWYGMFDHSGACLPHEEGACNCDRCGFGLHDEPVQKKPSFMVAAIGDSMTTAFNSGGSWNQLQNSWATGAMIDSHVQKLKRKYPNYDVEYINSAFPGVKSEDLVRQLLTVNRFDLDYATILIGANDLCSGTLDLEEYQYNIDMALDQLIMRSPDIKILVSSIPDIKQALEVSRDNECNVIWKEILRRCPAVSDMTALAHTWEAMNLILETSSMRHPRNVMFAPDVASSNLKPGDISNTDCFHPSVVGQQGIADATWKLGWYNK